MVEVYFKNGETKFLKTSNECYIIFVQDLVLILTGFSPVQFIIFSECAKGTAILNGS